MIYVVEIYLNVVIYVIEKYLVRNDKNLTGFLSFRFVLKFVFVF